jgi:hypothetical protein
VDYRRGLECTAPSGRYETVVVHADGVHGRTEKAVLLDFSLENWGKLT